MSLRFEAVTDAIRFNEIQAAWNELWRRCEGYVFQSHAWLSSWLKASAGQQDMRLLVVMAWDEQTLVGGQLTVSRSEQLGKPLLSLPDIGCAGIVRAVGKPQ